MIDSAYYFTLGLAMGGLIFWVKSKEQKSGGGESPAPRKSAKAAKTPARRPKVVTHTESQERDIELERLAQKGWPTKE